MRRNKMIELAVRQAAAESAFGLKLSVQNALALLLPGLMGNAALRSTAPDIFVAKVRYHFRKIAAERSQVHGY